MIHFAVVENGEVTNIIVAESLEIALQVTGKLCVEIEDPRTVSIGDKFEETPSNTVK